MTEHEVSYDDITSVEALSFALPDPAKARGEVLSLLQSMIRNRCENFGDGKCKERPSILLLKEYLKTYGLEAETHARPERPDRLNLISSYGSGSPRIMLGPGHVDVVPVTPDAKNSPQDANDQPKYSGWEEEPWSGAVRDGTVYGRGAVRLFSDIVALHIS
ncbi:unnamed protein product, partial [Choristocarpus tenellus]